MDFMLLLLAGVMIVLALYVPLKMIFGESAVNYFFQKLFYRSFEVTVAGAFSMVKKLFYKKPYNARFAGFWDKKKIFNSPLSESNNGLRLAPNKYLSQKDSFDHLLIIAPPGAGKTSCFVIPNVLESQMSLVVTDPSGEIFEKTSGHLQERGFAISLIDFGNPRRSLQFNPLIRIKDDPAKLKKILRNLVHQVIKGGDTFWRDKPLEVLQLFASALVNCEDDQYINFKNMDFMLANFGSAGLDSFMAQHLRDTLLRAKYFKLRSLSENLRDSVTASAQPVLNYFNDDPVLTHIFSADTLDINSLRTRPSVLYIVCPEKLLENYSLALNLIYEELFDVLMDMPSHSDLPIAMMMDEAGNQYIHQFDSILTTCRKRNISVSMIVQDLSQLKVRYEKDRAETIWKSVSTHLVFPGLPHETCKGYSEALGNISVRNPLGGETVRPLVTPDELRMLDQLIMISKDKKPVKLPIVPYFKDPTLSRASSKRPALTSLTPRLLDPELLDFS